MEVAVFRHRSVVPAPATDVFRWHERPEALATLTASPFVRVERSRGGIRNGGEVTLSIGIGPLRLRWHARHFGFEPVRQFCDEQVHGPFTVWRHVHRFEPIGTWQTLYEDEVEFVIPGGRLIHVLMAPIVGRLLAVLFAKRHRAVHQHFLEANVRRPSQQYAALLMVASLIGGMS